MIKDLLGITPYVLTLLMIMRSTFFKSDLNYVIPIVAIIYISNSREEIKEYLKKNYIFILHSSLILYMLATSLWSTEWNNTLLRALYFGFFSNVGIFIGYSFSKRNKLINIFLSINIFVVVSSFIALLFLRSDQSWMQITVVAFKGIFSHPNSLGSAVVFTLIPILLLWDMSRGKSILKTELYKPIMKIMQIQNLPSFFYSKKAFLILLVSLNILILGLTVSRASILIFFLAVSIWLILNYNLKDCFRYIIISILIVPITVILINGIMASSLDEYFYKGTSNLLSTREKIWSDSFEAAKNGGFFGLGLGESDKSINSPLLTHSSKRVREKGNGFLALIEEIGILGLLFFLLPITFLIFKGLKNKIRKERNFLNYASILTVFFVHTQFEAWLVGVTSFQLFLTYVVLGSLTFSLEKVENINPEIV